MLHSEPRRQQHVVTWPFAKLKFGAKPLSVLMVLLSVTILAPIILGFAGLIPALRFTGERIEVTVRPQAIEVNGLYVYANPWPIPWTQGLLVPFPVDASHPAPATVKVVEIDPRSGREVRTIPVLWIWSGPHFTVEIPAFGTTQVRVQFTQRCATPSATYLLTTTRPWGLPLERGDYVLQPQGVRITGSNYALNGQDHLRFARHHFMPEKEWTFTWIAE